MGKRSISKGLMGKRRMIKRIVCHKYIIVQEIVELMIHPQAINPHNGDHGINQQDNDGPKITEQEIDESEIIEQELMCQ